MKSFLEKLAPILSFVLLIAIFVAGFIIFSYLLIFVALIGIALYLLAWLRNLAPRKKKPEQKQGRIIDHEK